MVYAPGATVSLANTACRPLLRRPIGRPLLVRGVPAVWHARDHHRRPKMLVGLSGPPHYFPCSDYVALRHRRKHCGTNSLVLGLRLHWRDREIRGPKIRRYAFYFGAATIAPIALGTEQIDNYPAPLPPRRVLRKCFMKTHGGGAFNASPDVDRDRDAMEPLPCVARH
jgi:hypothetical protein